ncbi:MAG: hypothetical protein WAW02_14460 [Sideroxyarcus sp.]
MNTKNKGGRPKGVTSTNSQRRARVADRVLAQAEITPLDVMVKTMAKRWKAGDEAGACAIAKDCAPYLHARLASTTLKGDDQNPLFGLKLPSTEELKVLVRGTGMLEESN